MTGGAVRITASGTILASGKPCRVYGYTMRSTANGPGLVQLIDGTASTGAERWRALGNTDSSAEKSFSPGAGKYFPTGCYVQIDSNVTYVELDCSLENNT